MAGPRMSSSPGPEHEAELTLPQAPAACFDHIGRTRPVAGRVLKIGRAPQYFELAEGTRPGLIPSPRPEKVLTRRPGTVVLQALLPQSEVVLDESAWRLAEGREMVVPICVYNFGAKAVRGKLQVKTPENWTAEMPRAVEIAPGERKELKLCLTHPPAPGANQSIRVTGRFSGDGGAPVLSFRLTSSTR